MHFQEIFFDIKFKYSEKAKEILEKLTFYFQIFLNSHNTYLNFIIQQILKKYVVKTINMKFETIFQFYLICITHSG